MILVFDADGTEVKYGTADEQGNFLTQGHFDTPVSGLEEFLEKMEDVYHQAGDISVMKGLAFSLPGEMHSREGVIRGVSAVPYIHEVGLKGILGRRSFDLPVTMASDAKCAALGELQKDMAQKCGNVVFVICGTGISGAVIEHGKPYRGVTMDWGGFGNFSMEGFENGELLTWSDYTLEKQARKYGEKRNRTITGKELARLVEADEELAVGFLDEFCYRMAVGCIILEFSFDPEIIAIGGRISENRRIIQGIRKKTEELLEGQRSGCLRPNICACKNDDRANLYGALYYYLHQDVMEE